MCNTLTVVRVSGCVTHLRRTLSKTCFFLVVDVCMANQSILRYPYMSFIGWQFFFKTVLSSGYILILLSIEYILASLIVTCQA